MPMRRRDLLAASLGHAVRAEIECAEPSANTATALNHKHIFSGLREDTGSIEPGKRADFVLWDVADLPLAGGWDPVAALVLCGPVTAREVRVEGRAVVREHRITGRRQEDLAQEARAAAVRLAEGV